jgi:hypothetical protein
VDPNDFPFAYVASAAFQALTEWVERAAPPARADRITVNSAVTPPQIVRDALGNALGGVRTPFLDVPIARYTPFDTVAHTTALSGFCILYGYNVSFDKSGLRSLYRNHGGYVSRFVQQGPQPRLPGLLAAARSQRRHPEGRARKRAVAG